MHLSPFNLGDIIEPLLLLLILIFVCVCVCVLYLVEFYKQW